MEITKIQIDSIIFNSGIMPDGNRHFKALPNLSVVQSVTGSYAVGIDGGPLSDTGEGGFFIAPSIVTQEIIHCAPESQSFMNARWAFLDVSVNSAYRLDYLYEFPLILPKELNTEMNAAFDALFESRSVCDTMIAGYRIIKLLLSIAAPKKIRTSEPILNVINYIAAKYNEPLKVDDMARMAHMSKSHFFAVFKTNLGISPMAYLNNYRLARASVLLACSSMPVNSIAREVGFDDQLYFSRLFKRAFGLSPQKYRGLLNRSV
ncbi:MAG: AraC family transcriptional regulator [Clostridia bacterium]|nr:AraC family transcriptional regulator [Clostridia bacterium]